MKIKLNTVPENSSAHQQFFLMTQIAQKVSVVNVDGYYLGRNILFDFDLDYINNTLSNWDSIDKVDFDAKLCAIINENRDWIIKYAIEALPSRKNIIESIFKLYDEKKLCSINSINSYPDRRYGKGYHTRQDGFL
ncbi:hypothetical protein CJD36_003420 [Flavipsychrobacter stenotrophus]|uniref:Uncharacterized protein n=1 Tax=Flavipsychrobacter stenotrophus TaxID=2077091 RepID=A0A2S7T1T6_9BACT|nr:hypothetical protein [Flavipsychrobacter stenotrophus]PQJ12807.1 hypothetical protein CJD36_003420 [Flavipsychrobacter stenotrophus]